MNRMGSLVGTDGTLTGWMIRMNRMTKTGWLDDCLTARMIRFANGMGSFGIGMDDCLKAGMIRVAKDD